jgi:nicotinamide-nucleotide adenylyltransferase
MVFDRVGMIARWRPVHLGHARVLQALCDKAREALIGVGSANRYNARNPFTAAETIEMIRLALGDRQNYRVLGVDDLDDGPRWRELVKGLFGPLDAFVTENAYVAHLLRADYRILRPIELLPVAKRVPIDGTSVRHALARGDGWRALVPNEVAAFIVAQGLDARLRREFGLETLSQMVDLLDGRPLDAAPEVSSGAALMRGAPALRTPGPGPEMRK